MKAAALILLTLLNINNCYARCLVQNQGEILSIEVSSCEKISYDKIILQVEPIIDSKIKNIQKFYTGALIKDKENRTWIYPTDKEDPCKDFTKGSTIEKSAYYSCCDSGKWGKCLLGGKFLGDLDGEKIDAFQ
jgi:hypothetical protein